MSVSNSGSNNSYDDEAIAQLASRVEELEAAVSDKDDRIDELEQRVDDQDEEIEELQEKIESEGDRRSAEIEGCHSRISRVEEKIEEETPTPQPEETDIQEPETALESVCSLPEETAEENLTANQQRARFVAKDIADYGRKVPAGIAIKSSEIRRVLTAAEESKTHTQTVRRVIEFLNRFGDSEVNEKKTRSGETTVVFTEEIVERLATLCVIEERQPAVIETAI
jgi:chromosome segregation ATPase